MAVKPFGPGEYSFPIQVHAFGRSYWIWSQNFQELEQWLDRHGSLVRPGILALKSAADSLDTVVSPNCKRAVGAFEDNAQRLKDFKQAVLDYCNGVEDALNRLERLYGYQEKPKCRKKK